MDLDINKIREIWTTGKEVNDDESLKLIGNSWNNPRRLLDGDLEKLMVEAKGGDDLLGNHSIKLTEVGIIIEALRSPQYKNFMFHLFYHLTDQDTFPVRLFGVGCKCAMCGKDLLYWEEWNDTVKLCPGLGEFQNRNFLAYGAKTSKTCVCLDCLIHLKFTRELLDGVDPGIINFKKRTQSSLKP